MSRTASMLLSFLLLAASLSSASARAEAAPAAASGDPAAAWKASFKETGRFGVLGALTEELWKGGVVYEHQHFEAQLLAHAGFEPDEDTRDVHIDLKLGGRVPLGASLNYLAFGGEVGTFPGSEENGVNVGKSFTLAPYLSLQRYFAATPLMLVLWVNPVQYGRIIHPDEDGGTRVSTTWRVFQTGGFGLAYLF